MEYRVHYDGSDPKKITSVVMNLEVELDGDVAVFNDPLMVSFADDAIDTFESYVKDLPFVEDTRREFEEAYEEWDGE